MSMDGTFNLEIGSPMGKRIATLMMKIEGNSLSGTLKDEKGETELKDPAITAEGFSFSASTSTPIGPVNLTFTGSVEGDSISGKVKTGHFGSFPFTGVRV